MAGTGRGGVFLGCWGGLEGGFGLPALKTSGLAIPPRHTAPVKSKSTGSTSKTTCGNTCLVVSINVHHNPILAISLAPRGFIC